MTSKSDPIGHPGLKLCVYMFRSWGAVGSPIFAEIEGGRGQNGTFLGDFTWNDPSGYVMPAKQLYTHISNPRTQY